MRAFRDSMLYALSFFSLADLFDSSHWRFLDGIVRPEHPGFRATTLSITFFHSIPPMGGSNHELLQLFEFVSRHKALE